MDTHSMIILGNGFDVALGIETRFSQFYERSQDLRDFANSGNSLCQHILDNIKDGYWSDLECGLYKYSLAITQKYGIGNQEQADKFKHDFDELRTALFNYLKNAAGATVEVIKEAPALGLNVEWHKLEPQYLTFNYSINTANTASMNGRYILNGDDSINESHFIYQHGSIYDMQACKNRLPGDIVVGIDPCVQPVEAAHSFLYKTQQRLYNLTSTLDFISKKCFYVVYGCSVGDSDATYFRTIFNQNQQDKIFLIYGFGQESIDSIKTNIERICNIEINMLEVNNHVYFLDVKQVEETRNITREVVENYIKTIVM